jgi:hypothetical protein
MFVRPSCGRQPEPIVLDLNAAIRRRGSNLSVLLGRHGAMNPAGGAGSTIARIAKDYSGASQLFFPLRNLGSLKPRHVRGFLLLSARWWT